MPEKLMSREDAFITFRVRYEQWLNSQESVLKSILGKDGKLSLTVSTDMGLLSVDTNLRSKVTTTEEIQTQMSWRQPPLLGTV